MKRITKATFKKFISDNLDALYVQEGPQHTDFKGGLIKERKQGKAQMTDSCIDHTLGVRGVWLTGGGADIFKPYEDAYFVGISVDNPCGCFTVSILKQ